MKNGKIGLMIAAVAAAFAFTSPAHALVTQFYSVTCTGPNTDITCVFDASAFGNLFISAQAADLNVSGSNITASATSTPGLFGTVGATITASVGSQQVDSVGTFNVTTDLHASPGPPKADTITIEVKGTNLVVDQTLFAAHICLNGETTTNAGSCTSTFFTNVPAPIVGAGLPGLVMACGGLVALARRRQQKIV
jgi:hypothetical protein